jgi:hypothetical protein
MKPALALSVAINAILVVVLIMNRGGGDEGKQPAPISNDLPYCETLKKDLDFFIEGLEKKNDPFYSPLAVRTMSGLLPSCFPAQKTRIDAALGELRNHLVYIVAANTSDDQKREAHDNALRLFRELRALWGEST